MEVQVKLWMTMGDVLDYVNKYIKRKHSIPL